MIPRSNRFSARVSAARVSAGNGRLESLSGDQFDGADQPDAAGLADERMVANGAEAIAELGRHGPDHADDVSFLVDLQGLEGDGAATGWPP